MTRPHFIQVASGKGGVGKTWAAITLADALAAGSRKVLLFDADFGLANVDVQLGLAPKHDLGSVIAGHAQLDEAITKYRIPSLGGLEAGARFDVLAGKSGSGALSGLSPLEVAALNTGLTNIADQYAHVIIDLASGLDPAGMSFCAPGSTTLVLVTDEPTSLTDAYAYIKLLSFQDPAADIRIAVNMAEGADQAQRTYAALSKATRNFLGLTPPLAGVIPRDEMVRNTIRQQMPILFRHPQARASVAMRQLSQNILKPNAQLERKSPIAATA